NMNPDCDQDPQLLLAKSAGPACHRGPPACFGNAHETSFLLQHEEIVRDREEDPVEGSYVNKLRGKGLTKIAQKVGEEATETVIAALAQSHEDLLDESADLVFHLLVLLREKNISLAELGEHLRKRHK